MRIARTEIALVRAGRDASGTNLPPAFPLALRQEQAYTPCRSRRGTDARIQTRTPARHARSSNSTHPHARPRTRLGHLRAHPANFEEGAAGAARLALSRPASSRAPRLDQSALEHLRK